MSDKEIKISPALREYLTLMRNKKNLSSVALSLLIGKNKYWFDDIENEKIQSIQPEDLKLLFYVLIPKVERYISDTLMLSIIEIIESFPFEFVVARVQRTKLFSLQRAIFLKELRKQTFFSGRFSMSINDNMLMLENELNLPKNYFNSIFSCSSLDFSKNSINTYYEGLKKVFLNLNYIEPEFIDKYLHFLGVPTPNVENMIPCLQINSCYKYDNDLGNVGKWLDEQLQNLENMDSSETYNKKICNSEQNHSQKIKPENYYVFNKKQELYSKVTQATNILNQIIDKIDENNYSDTIKYEAIVTTILELLTTANGLEICEHLFKYPIYKLQSSHLSIIDKYLSDLIDYKYCIIKENNCNEKIFNIVNLLKKYIYLDCISKENLNVLDCNDSIQSVFPD